MNLVLNVSYCCGTNIQLSYFLPEAVIVYYQKPDITKLNTEHYEKVF